MGSVAESWRQIEEVLKEHANSVFRSLRKPATEPQLRQLEKLVGSKLPKDFVQSLKIHDGLRDSYLGSIRLFDYWALLPVSAITTEYSTLMDSQREDAFGGSQFDVSPRIKKRFPLATWLGAVHGCGRRQGRDGFGPWRRRQGWAGLQVVQRRQFRPCGLGRLVRRMADGDRGDFLQAAIQALGIWWYLVGPSAVAGGSGLNESPRLIARQRAAPHWRTDILESRPPPDAASLAGIRLEHLARRWPGGLHV